MKILFVTDNFYPETNAPASRTLEHARAWARDGHEVTVLTTAPNFPEGKLFPGYRNRWLHRESVDGIQVVRVKSYITANEGVLRRTLDYLSFMIAAILVSPLLPRSDVVVGTSPQFFAAWGASVIARLQRRPFVFELRDLWPASIVQVGAMKPNLVVRMLERIELGLYRRASLIVSLTQAFKQDLVQRGIAANKIEVVQNGVDLTRFSAAPRDEELARELELQNCFVVGYLGTHGMAHGLHAVVDAAALLAHRADIAFIMVGAGAEKKSLQARAAKLGLSNLTFLPRQPKERMPSLLGVCNLCLVPLRDLPLFRTVLPSKIFEAMGMGIPILAAIPRGEASELIERLDVGEVVDPEDPHALALAIDRLHASPQRLDRYRRNANCAAPAFDREALARRMIEAIEARLGGRQP
ncbi:glycosyltransferase family 4 protein [Bordetella bronchialis]|uniref:glycosyltransferase family 4 protein n=1 Tax=Bordetella bronchialis TaxID=463025 RepID=UPI003D02FD29